MKCDVLARSLAKLPHNGSSRKAQDTPNRACDSRSSPKGRALCLPVAVREQERPGFVFRALSLGAPSLNSFFRSSCQDSGCLRQSISLFNSAHPHLRWLFCLSLPLLAEKIFLADCRRWATDVPWPVVLVVNREQAASEQHDWPCFRRERDDQPRERWADERSAVRGRPLAPPTVRVRAIDHLSLRRRRPWRGLQQARD